MNIVYEKEFENLFEGSEYYRIFNPENPIDRNDPKKYPNMTLNNFVGKWELTIYYRGTNLETTMYLGKLSEWPFDKLKPVLDDFIKAYWTMVK